MPDGKQILTSELPKCITLESCDFPIVSGDINGYKVLELPLELRCLFEDGADVVRINSLDVAGSIPNYGGKASGENHSLLPHQDHLDPTSDARRYLMLSKRTDGSRGSSTLVMSKSSAESMLPLIEAWIRDGERRALIGVERSYDRRFLISEAQYNGCFDDDDGYERVIRDSIGSSVSSKREVALRLGIMGYLIRGSRADIVMREVYETCHGAFIEEKWESGGIVILDNPGVFHARIGGNFPPLQRNFCT